MRFPISPNKTVPHLDVNADLGNFTYAVHQMPPGKDYMAGEYLTWPDFAKTWAKVTGATIRFSEVSVDDMVNDTPDKECGREVSLMFAYSSDPGYDGAMDLLKAEDLRAVSAQSQTFPTRHPVANWPSQAGIHCPMLSVEESLATQDWSAVLNK